MMDKTLGSVAEAVSLVPDGAVVMIGGFGSAGSPIELIHALKKEKESFGEMGIDLEEKSFYDILKSLAHKYDFDYPEDKLIKLAKEVKTVVDDKRLA